MSSHAPEWPARPLAPTLAPLLGTSETSPRAAFERLSSAGFRHVHLSATHPGLRSRDLDASARRDLLALLRRCELMATGLDAWIPSAHFADPSQVDRAMAAVQAATELAANLGRLPLSLILPDDEELVRSLIDCALHHGVELADHAVPMKPRESVGVGIDPAAWLAAGLDAIETIPRCHASLSVVRLCDLSLDGMRSPAGSPGGRLNLASYRLALDLAGYNRAIVIDARQWADPWAGIQVTRDHWESSAPFPARRI